LKNTGVSIAYACSWPFYYYNDGKMEVGMEYNNNNTLLQPDYNAIVKTCNVWRNYDDISMSWKSILSIIDFYTKNQEKYAQYHGPQHWNDPDMVRLREYEL
jgi:hypothetical protein